MIHRPHRTIIIGAHTQFEVKVSPEDYDFLMQWKWTFARSHGPWSGLIYARRSVHSPAGNITILMHRVILLERMQIERPSEKHYTDHENGHPLDNRRVNDTRRTQLRWLTPKENMANQKGICVMPLSVREWEQQIPF